MAMFTLRQLRAAVALAETGHFGRAAERCHVSQPAISQQIRLLEAACGVSLFDRLGTSVQPTPFGRDFIERARLVIDAASDLEGFAAAQGGEPNRALRFGLIPTVAPYLLPDIFPALRHQFPAIAFKVSESRTDALVAGLYDASLDLALIATAPPDNGPQLAAETLFEDSFVLATGAGEVVQAPVQLGGVSRDRLLLLDEGHCFRDQTLAACGLASEVDHSTFAATSLSTVVEFVANGQGITLLPEIALRKESANARIRLHRLAAPGAARQLSLVWRAASPYAELFRSIAATIREVRFSGPMALNLEPPAPTS